jgi:hypothetical protein
MPLFNLLFACSLLVVACDLLIVPCYGRSLVTIFFSTCVVLVGCAFFVFVWLSLVSRDFGAVLAFLHF